MQNAHFPPRRCDISVDLSATLMENSYAFFPSRLRADRNFHRHFLHRFLTLPWPFRFPWLILEQVAIACMAHFQNSTEYETILSRPS